MLMAGKPSTHAGPATDGRRGGSDPDDASRSRSRSTRRSTSSLMTPSSRSRMIASRSATRTASGSPGGRAAPARPRRVVVRVGSDVAGLVLVPGAELVDELGVVRILLGEAVEPVERGRRRRPGARRLLAVRRSMPHEPSRRMSHGSVRPWPTSVARITQKVRKRRRSRCGKSSGRARAAASETAPRMPGPRDDEDGPRRRLRVALPDRALSRRGR